MKRIAIGLACCVWLSTAVFAEGDKRTKFTGILETGIVAIGGESTGIVLRTKEKTWELDFRDNKEFLKKADEWNGKQVTVEGEATQKGGVEILERHIIHVRSIRPAAATNDEKKKAEQEKKEKQEEEKRKAEKEAKKRKAEKDKKPAPKDDAKIDLGQ
jgi:hypothetical protein